LAEEAARIEEEGRNFARRKSTRVADSALHEIAGELEIRAGRGFSELVRKVGEGADGKSLEGVLNIGAWIFGFKILDRLEAAAREDIAEVDTEGRHGFPGGCAGDWAVLAGREAVQEGEVVELSVATSLLDEVVVEIVHATGVGTEKNAVRDQVLTYICSVDSVKETLEFSEFLRRPARIA
jgi:hypothetical protein